MGRSLLMVCAAALLAACAPDDRQGVEHGSPGDTTAATPRLTSAGAPDTASSTGPDGHADLPCAACHSGPLVRGRLGAVERESCAAAGCHEEGGPITVATGTATFPHQDHGSGGDIALSCAGCHTHDEGRAPLRVTSDGCALCHLTDLRGSEPADCRLCHQQPNHVAMTSQALPIPHSSLPWVETGCVRCHYDVAEPRTNVATARCTGCHGRDTTVIAQGIASDLHPSHTSVTCTGCHEGDSHRVRAMSSAVRLNCADCHTTSHDVSLPAEWSDPATCGSCHQTVHQPQQRLLLGVLPDGTSAPSSKFIAGITCRSCHIRTGDVQSDAPIRGQAEACAGCHRNEYRQVLDWWLEGTKRHTADLTAYVAGARSALAGAAGPDSVQVLVNHADALVTMVREAGGQHNLELSDRAFRRAVADVQRAYQLAGRVPPAQPALGSPAHQGVCSFCHYAPDEPWDFRRMSASFHADVMEARK